MLTTAAAVAVGIVIGIPLIYAVLQVAVAILLWPFCILKDIFTP